MWATIIRIIICPDPCISWPLIGWLTERVWFIYAAVCPSSGESPNVFVFVFVFAFVFVFVFACPTSGESPNELRTEVGGSHVPSQTQPTLRNTWKFQNSHLENIWCTLREAPQFSFQIERCPDTFSACSLSQDFSTQWKLEIISTRTQFHLIYVEQTRKLLKINWPFLFIGRSCFVVYKLNLPLEPLQKYCLFSGRSRIFVSHKKIFIGQTGIKGTHILNLATTSEVGRWFVWTINQWTLK